MKSTIFHLDAGVPCGGYGAGGQLRERCHITTDAHPENIPAEPSGAGELELTRSCSSGGGPAQTGT